MAEGNIIRYCAGYVLGNIHKDRSGSSCRGDPESLADGVGKILYILNNVSVLGYGHGDTCDIYLLERILSKKRQGDVAGDRNERDAVHICGGDTGNQIGRAGAAGSQTDADFSRCPGIAVGHVGSSLFMG